MSGKLTDNYPISVEEAQLISCQLFLNELNTDQIRSLANNWLDQGYYSEPLSEIFYGADQVRSLFTEALRGLGASDFSTLREAVYYRAFRVLKSVQHEPAFHSLLNAGFKVQQLSERLVTDKNAWDTFGDLIDARDIVKCVFQLEHDTEMENYNHSRVAAADLRKAMRAWLERHPQGLP